MLRKFLFIAILALVLGEPGIVAAAATDDEQVALQIVQAEAAVKRAAAQRALWTTAEDALALAKKYLAEGNVGKASAPAALARELAELGLAQTAYPLFSE